MGTPIRPVLLFVHGWAFDASLWDGLRAQLADWPHAVADAGYFRQPSWPEVSGPVVAIGHSHGFMRLLARLPAGCRALVGINAFSRFTAAPDLPQGVAARVVDRMLARLDAHAAMVVDDFRQRCGGTPAKLAPDGGRLRADLQALRDGDARAELDRSGLPTLALAGDADAIVPPGLSTASFAGRADTRLEWREGGDHLLPVSAAAWCAERLRAYLDELAAREDRG